MKPSTVFSALAAFFLAGVHAQSVEAPIPGYGVQDFSWEVETTPGGEKVVLNGTIQEVYTELLKINPRYDGDFAERRIEEGIRYLHSVPGQPTNGPGPGNCGRVSCSYNSAIWWCNDNTSPKTLPGFYNIAQGAQVVINQCDPTGVYVSGEENHADKWRAVVRYNVC
ncbi:hypothetical protein BDV38DRAFT_294917 [Aspergillus pseudotamarii]|uniref:Uncharacterized protein n=1 Tax=Aspergillus pseudotamarii TaxID=132259 RepID=A0A5N6SN12_ASPPS|nr:uncharacterized protein BDV38DRAFT_294917 [Aspergillus pseudotamarii]KAE8135101.1 hypothetical protein BDV38DRAFT_294917 [Aspergillus pseudotamarii]